MRKESLYTLLAVAAVGLAAYYIFFGSSMLGPMDLGIGQVSFDQWAWKQAHGDFTDRNPRQDMARAVKRRLQASKPTRDEVLELLGPPDRTVTGKNLGYTLATYDDGIVDYLEVIFKGNGRFDEARIVRP